MAQPSTDSLSARRRDDALAVLRRLREAGHEAYFAGGCVRDVLLGRSPEDYDVATNAQPQRVRDLFRQTQSVGAAFGVILVKHRASTIEVATFRCDGTYIDGRRPSTVTFASAEEDAKRRDFTINGLFLDPLENRVIDYVGGQADLAAGLVRAIGDANARFEEDTLRLLRAVRFSARLGFPIEPATAAAIRAHARQLKRISPERIGEELRNILTPPWRGAAWPLLWDLKLAPEIFRFLPAPVAPAPQSGPFLFLQLDPGEPIPFALALAAAVVCYQLRMSAGGDVRQFLARESAIAAAQAMRKALKISNEEYDGMVGTLGGAALLLAEPAPGLAGKKRFLARPTANLTRALLGAIERQGLDRERIRAMETELKVLAAGDYAPPPLLNGDILSDLGLTPGPLFKRILNDVYDEQLEGRISSAQAARARAMELAGR